MRRNQHILARSAWRVTQKAPASWCSARASPPRSCAGYNVTILEHNDRAGGRTWTIRGGDRFTEMGGAMQDSAFDKGLYINPGPWRIPYHHRAMLDYCKRLDVALEPFVQVNHNAYVHAAGSVGGRPQRYREVQADFNGMASELLSKAVRTDALEGAVAAGISLPAVGCPAGWCHQSRWRPRISCTGGNGARCPPGSTSTSKRPYSSRSGAWMPSRAP
jgi:hypothetical protein